MRQTLDNTRIDGQSHVHLDTYQTQNEDNRSFSLFDNRTVISNSLFEGEIASIARDLEEKSRKQLLTVEDQVRRLHDSQTQIIRRLDIITVSLIYAFYIFHYERSKPTTSLILSPELLTALANSQNKRLN